MENPKTDENQPVDDEQKPTMFEAITVELLETNIPDTYDEIKGLGDFRKVFVAVGLGGLIRWSLDRNLKTRLHYDIFKQLRSNREIWHSPLGFLKLFNRRIRFVQRNKHKPLFVVSQLDRTVGWWRHPLDEARSRFLCEKLLEYFHEMRGVDCELDMCCREIENRYHVKYQLEGSDESNTPEANDENDPEQLRRRVVVLLMEELIPKFSEMIPAQKAEFLALLTGRTKKGFEQIVNDHRYASNFKQTQRTASEWLEKLK